MFTPYGPHAFQTRVYKNLMLYRPRLFVKVHKAIVVLQKFYEPVQIKVKAFVQFYSLFVAVFSKEKQHPIHENATRLDTLVNVEKFA